MGTRGLAGAGRQHTRPTDLLGMAGRRRVTGESLHACMLSPWPTSVHADKHHLPQMIWKNFPRKRTERHTERETDRQTETETEIN